MNPPGHNPMRWNCLERGCFNLHKRPKIEVFAECFPRSINFSDVDGIVEINGQALLLEWKPGQDITTGQRIMYSRLTQSSPLTVFVVAGDARSMAVQARCVFRHGHQSPWRQCTLQGIMGLFRRWAAWADQQPATLRLA